jgi:hypothetical protein
VLGARWISQKRVAGGDDDDIRLDHPPYGTPYGGDGGRGSTRSGDGFPRQADERADVLCDLLAMYTNYPAIWSARLVPPAVQAPSHAPINVMVRIVYNTLDGIVNDYFVVTASVAAR